MWQMLYVILLCHSCKSPQMPTIQKVFNSLTHKITYFCPVQTAYSNSHLSMAGCYPVSVKSHPHRWLIPMDLMMVTCNGYIFNAEWGKAYIACFLLGVENENTATFFNNLETFIETIPLDRKLLVNRLRQKDQVCLNLFRGYVNLYQLKQSLKITRINKWTFCIWWI